MTVDGVNFGFMVHWESNMELGHGRGHASTKEKKALAESAHNGPQSVAVNSHALCLQRLLR